MCLDIPAATYDTECAFWSELTGWPVVVFNHGFIQPQQYIFVQERDFVQPVIVRHVVPQTRNVTVV